MRKLCVLLFVGVCACDAPRVHEPTYATPAIVAGQVMGLRYSLRVEPYEHQPRRWFYLVSMIVHVPEASGAFEIKTFYQTQKAGVIVQKSINPFALQTTHQTNHYEPVTSPKYADDYSRSALLLKPGKVHHFKHDARLGLASKQAIEPGHEMTLKVCLASLSRPATMAVFEPCLAKAKFTVSEQNIMNVTLQSQHEQMTPVSSVLKMNLGENIVHLSPFKKGWDVLNHQRREDSSGTITIPAQRWRRESLTLMYRANEVTLGRRRYQNLSKGKVWRIKGSVLLIDGVEPPFTREAPF